MIDLKHKQKKTNLSFFAGCCTSWLAAERSKGVANLAASQDAAAAKMLAEYCGCGAQAEWLSGEMAALNSTKSRRP
jgi:hypothetical protein